MGRTCPPDSGMLQEWVDNMLRQYETGGGFDGCSSPARSICAKWGMQEEKLYYSALLPHIPTGQEVDIDLAVPLNLIDWEAMVRGVQIMRTVWALYVVKVRAALHRAMARHGCRLVMRGRVREEFVGYLSAEQNRMFSMLLWTERYYSFLRAALALPDHIWQVRIYAILDDSDDESNDEHA